MTEPSASEVSIHQIVHIPRFDYGWPYDKNTEFESIEKLARVVLSAPFRATRFAAADLAMDTAVRGAIRVAIEDSEVDETGRVYRSKISDASMPRLTAYRQAIADAINDDERDISPLNGFSGTDYGNVYLSSEPIPARVFFINSVSLIREVRNSSVSATPYCRLDGQYRVTRVFPITAMRRKGSLDEAQA